MSNLIYMKTDFFTLAWLHRIGIVSIEKIFAVLYTLLIIVIIKYLISRAINVWLLPPWSKEKLASTHIKRLTTLQAILNSTLLYVLVLIGGMQIIKIIGGDKYDITPLLTTAGVTGIAIGLGAQKLIKDTISGFFILLEDQYNVGDYVMLNDSLGVVETVGMRISRLRDDMGRLIILANGDVVKVTNYSRGVIEGPVEVGFAATAPSEKALEAINKACKEFKSDDLFEAPKVMGITSYDTVKVTVKLALKAEPKLLPSLQNQLREKVREALLQAEIPPA